MRRLITTFFCLLVLFSTECIFLYADGPKSSVTLSFSAPQKSQKMTAGKPFACKGIVKTNPANSDKSKVYVWLVLMDVQQGCYYIQRPVTINKDGSWAATLTFRKNTPRLIAVTADSSTDKLFKSWLAKNPITKQYELPRSTQILATVDIKL